MYVQIEVDYYSNEANINKYINFQLIASIKNNFKIVEDQMYGALYLQRQLFMLCCLDLKVLCCLDYCYLEKYFKVQVMFV